MKLHDVWSTGYGLAEASTWSLHPESEAPFLDNYLSDQGPSTINDGTASPADLQDETDIKVTE